MSDRQAGTTWSNPIWYRDKWRIYLHDNIGPHKWDFVHDDYDGAPDGNDNRYGHADSIEEAHRLIDALEEEAEDA